MAQPRTPTVFKRFRRWLANALRGEPEVRGQFRSLAENSSDPIARTDLERHFLYVNPAHCELVGRKAGQLLGLDWQQAGAPAHVVTLFARHSAQVITSTKTCGFEIALPGPAGLRWFEARLMPELDDRGKVATILIVQREFTERRRLDQRREELERQQRALLDGIAERAWLKDCSGRYVAANRQLAGLTGYSPHELAGKTAWDILSPASAAACEAEDREVTEQGKPIRIEHRCELDHHQSWRETIKVPLYNSSGRVIGLIGSSRDITAQKLATEQLAASEYRLKLALRAAKSGAWEWRPGSSTSYWSDELYAVLGFTRDRVAPSYSSWLARVHQDDRARFMEMIESCVREGDEFHAEYRIVLENGAIRWVSDIGVMHGEGGARLMVGIVTDITDRKLAEHRQRELEYTQQALLDGIADSVWLKDLEGRVLAVNLEFERRVGMSRQDIIGRKTTDFRPAGLSEFFVQEDSEVIGSGQPLRIERSVQRNGMTYWRELIKMPVKDDQDRVIGTAGVSRDVTERKKMEQALQQSHEMLNTILDTSPIAIIAYDSDFRVTFWNTSAERIFGWSQQEAMGQPLPAIPAENRGDIEALQEGMLRHEMLTSIETVWHRRDGTPVEIMLSGAVIRDSARQATGSVVICTDVTERNREQRALLASDEQFRVLAEDVQAVFWIGTRDFSRIDYVSPGFEGLWDMPRSAIYKEPRAWMRNIHADDSLIVERFLETQAKGMPASAECRVVRQDGSMRWVRARSFPHQSSRLENCVTGIVTDITDVKAVAADRLAQAERQRDILVQEVHHRIKNHLQGVAGLLHLHASDVPEARKTLEKAITQIQSVAVIHGLQGLRTGNEILLCEMVPAIVDMMRALSDTPADVISEAQGTQPVRIIEHESVPVALIITELVHNAVKHSSPLGSRVTVNITTAPDSASVRIFNSGTLPHDQAARPARNAGGAGLGLVQALMPPHGASFELIGHDAGVEARLTLSYPVVVTASPPETSNTTVEGTANAVARE